MPYVDIPHDIINSFQSGATAFKPVLRTDVGFDSKVGFGYRLQNPVFGANIAIDLSQGNYIQVIVTASTNITLVNPINVPKLQAFPIIIEISNQSGGAMGTVSFGNAFKNPATAPFSTPPTSTNFQLAGYFNIGTQAAPNWHMCFNQSSNAPN